MYTLHDSLVGHYVPGNPHMFISLRTIYIAIITDFLPIKLGSEYANDFSF